MSFALLAEDHETGPEIDPDSISRTLSHLLTKWKRACKRYNPKQRADIEELAKKISDAAIHRNTICHGFQEIKTDGTNPKDFTIECYQKFHQIVMTHDMPELLTFDRFFLIDLVVETRDFTDRVKALTDVAIAKRESIRGPAAK